MLGEWWVSGGVEGSGSDISREPTTRLATFRYQISHGSLFRCNVSLLLLALPFPKSLAAESQRK